MPTHDDGRQQAALYIRVSDKDDQTSANQEPVLRRWAKRLGLKIVRVYADSMTGARHDRAGLTQVLEGAHRREFDVLLVWALDRLSREGIGPMQKYLDRLRDVGIRIMSHEESWLDTSPGPVGDLLVAVFAWVAQQERRRISERTKLGLERARKAGKILGRPREITDEKAATIRQHRTRGVTIRKIAQIVGVGVGSVERALHASTIPTRPRRRPMRRRRWTLNP